MVIVLFACFQGEEISPGVGQHHILLFLSGVGMQILEGSSVGPGIGGQLWSWMLKEGEKSTVTPQIVGFGGFVAAALAP